MQSLAASATALRFVFYTCDLSTTTGRKRSQRSRKAGVTTVLMNTITWYISAVMMEQSMEEQLNDSFIIQGIDESFADASFQCEEVEVTEQYGCDHCDFKTVYKSNMIRHKRRMHSASESSSDQHFICSTCGKTFRSKFGMTLHHKGVHEGKYRFTCLVCDRKFNVLGNYKGHMASHDPVLREKCESCKATFRYRKSLVRHKLVCGKPRDCDYTAP